MAQANVAVHAPDWTRWTSCSNARGRPGQRLGWRADQAPLRHRAPAAQRPAAGMDAGDRRDVPGRAEGPPLRVGRSGTAGPPRRTLPWNPCCSTPTGGTEHIAQRRRQTPAQTRPAACTCAVVTTQNHTWQAAPDPPRRGGRRGLRGARQGPHHAPPRDPARSPGNLRGSRAPPWCGAPARPGNHRRGASPVHAHLDEQHLAGEWAHQLLGIQHPELLHRTPATPRRPRGPPGPRRC
ncbi:hypothetical protein QJS66_09525 [Kocuria rhizophila]|nr:hypothetical protein QJS66_09525 [Kocuria rhizophila]